MTDDLYPEHGLHSGELYRKVYNQLLDIQRGKCAICEKGLGEYWRWTTAITRLVIDHNHQNGEIRGILCSGCNTMLANYENERESTTRWLLIHNDQFAPDYLDKIKAYLKRPRLFL